MGIQRWFHGDARANLLLTFIAAIIVGAGGLVATRTAAVPARPDPAPTRQGDSAGSPAVGAGPANAPSPQVTLPASPTSRPAPAAGTTRSPAADAAVLRNRPVLPASVMWADAETTDRALAYARPGGLVVAGRTNYQDLVFKDVSRSGGTVLIYLDVVIDNDWGRYHVMLHQASECGPATALWPGNQRANQWGYLTDFRVGRVIQQKLECVLEAMVRENPHMGGWFADDVGSRSWFPDIDWDAWSVADMRAYRDGAVELTKTFRRVADRYGLIFFVNGTWGAGPLASDGGGYPDANRHGNALADGGYVEHHGIDELPYFGPYACSSQWAAQSPVTRGTSFMWAVTDTIADRNAYANSGCYAFVNRQPTAEYDFAPPWTDFHATGLPSKVG